MDSSPSLRPIMSGSTLLPRVPTLRKNTNRHNSDSTDETPYEDQITINIRTLMNHVQIDCVLGGPAFQTNRLRLRIGFDRRSRDLQNVGTQNKPIEDHVPTRVKARIHTCQR